MISKDTIHTFRVNDIFFCVVLPFPACHMLSDLLVSHPVNSVIAQHFIWLPDQTFRDGSKQVKAPGIKEGRDTNQRHFLLLSSFPLEYSLSYLRVVLTERTGV